MFELGLFCQN